MVVVVGGRVVVVGPRNFEMGEPGMVVTPGPGLVVELPGRVVPVALVVDECGSELGVDRGVVIKLVLCGTVVMEICDGRSGLALAEGMASAIPNAPAPVRNALTATERIRLVTAPVWRTGPTS